MRDILTACKVENLGEYHFLESFWDMGKKRIW